MSDIAKSNAKYLVLLEKYNCAYKEILKRYLSKTESLRQNETIINNERLLNTYLNEYENEFILELDNVHNKLIKPEVDKTNKEINEKKDSELTYTHRPIQTNMPMPSGCFYNS